MWKSPLLRGGQVGLEQTMVKPADLQSAAIAARRLIHMVERAELEIDTDYSVRSAKLAIPGPLRFTLHIC